MLVEILVTRECAHEDAAIDLVGTAAAELHVQPKVILIEIDDLADAEQHRFPGSPTIRINGQDVAPARPDSSLRCRVYDTPDGPSGLPDPTSVLAALRAAAERSL